MLNLRRQKKRVRQYSTNPEDAHQLTPGNTDWVGAWYPGKKPSTTNSMAKMDPRVATKIAIMPFCKKSTWCKRRLKGPFFCAWLKDFSTSPLWLGCCADSCGEFVPLVQCTGEINVLQHLWIGKKLKGSWDIYFSICLVWPIPKSLVAKSSATHRNWILWIPSNIGGCLKKTVGYKNVSENSGFSRPNHAF